MTPIDRQEPSIESLILDKITSVETNLNRRLDDQDKAASDFKRQVERDLGAIKKQTSETNGRVTKLERAREVGQAKLAAFHWVPDLLDKIITAALGGGVTILLLAVTGGIH